MKPILSNLDAPVWAIITATNVVCKNKTYAQCEMLLEGQNPYEATITTNEAAEKMENGKREKMENGERKTKNAERITNTQDVIKD